LPARPKQYFIVFSQVSAQLWQAVIQDESVTTSLVLFASVGFAASAGASTNKPKVTIKHRMNKLLFMAISF
jgi:hypothetical protein